MTLALLAAISLTATNAPAAFSTAVEQTFPAPVLTEERTGLDFKLDLPAVGTWAIELAVGCDANDDGRLADDESPFAVSVAGNQICVRNGSGEVLHTAAYTPHGVPLSLVLKVGCSRLPNFWRLSEGARTTLGEGSFSRAEGLAFRPDRVRIRVSGPDAVSANVSAGSVHDSFILRVR